VHTHLPHLKHEACVNSRHIHRDRAVDAVRGINAVCSENHTKHVITLTWRNAKKIYVKVSGTYSYHHALELERNMAELKLRLGQNEIPSIMNRELLSLLSFK
jgi:hypothetical protein